MPSCKVGDVKITRILERSGFGSEPGTTFIGWKPEFAEKYKDVMEPAHYDPSSGRLLLTIHSWLIQTPKHTIILDTATGNAKPRPYSAKFNMLDEPYLPRLAIAGVVPQDVDYVICTHIHADHVGWNTVLKDGKWVPTFPNAKYLFSRAEIEHWKPSGPGGSLPHRGQIFIDSVQPVIDAGQAVIFDGEHRLTDELHLVPAPGHAPGQFVAELSSKGQHAIFSADVVHYPVQVYEPQISIYIDTDIEQARQSRLRIFQRCVDLNALIFPSHFGRPHAGRIERRGDGFAFAVDEDVDMQ
jgi:glyoxylase-like metal-dependent hydrolase (beta-lactamase superfamily II)